MKKMHFKINRNNSGSTLVVVLIVIAFIAVLGSVSISAAMVNLKMKEVDKKTQKTFYSCEEAVDEIYSKLGMESMNALEKAYQDVMATMVRSDKSPAATDDDPSWNNYSINNEPSGVGTLNKADLELRKKYMNNVVNGLAIGSFDESNPMTLDINKLKTLLNSYISVDITNNSVKNSILAGTFYYPYVESIDNCYYTVDWADTSVYVFNAKNVKVTYITADGYKSQLTFDIGIKLPVSNINYTSATQTINAVPSLGEFSLIADNGIKIASNKQVLVDGNVYAGGGGILAKDSSRTTFISNQVITKTDVTTEKQTQITFSGSTQLWCDNIIIPKNYSVSGRPQPCHGVTINLNGSTFVKNDLKINGASSNVYVGGVYNGYSNSGVSDLNKDESSAIIVNGAHSNLTLKPSYIYLAGRSYIIYDGTTEEPYRTGESLSFKGDQEVYLVPPTAVNEAAGTVVGNPCASIAAVNGTKLSEYLTTKYFAKSLLSSSNPYVVKTVGGQYFIYLNFKDAKSSSDYMYWVLSTDDDFTAQMTTLGMSVEEIDTALKQKNYMKSLVEVNLKNLDQQTSGFIAPAGSVTTSGVMVKAEVNGSLAKTGAQVSMAADTKQQVTADLKNRYTALTNVLDMPVYSLESVTLAGGIPSSFAGQSGKNVDYNTICGYGSTVAERLVSRADVITASTVAISEGVQSLGGNIRRYGTGDYPIVVANGGYTFNSSSGFKGGIIVAIGNVNIEADYDGLVIALATDTTNGNININADVNISNTIDAASLVESICTQISDDAAEKLIKVFRGTRTGGTGGGSSEEKIEIDSITYSQLVYFNNWKKTEMN